MKAFEWLCSYQPYRHSRGRRPAALHLVFFLGLSLSVLPACRAAGPDGRTPCSCPSWPPASIHFQIPAGEEGAFASGAQGTLTLDPFEQSLSLDLTSGTGERVRRSYRCASWRGDFKALDVASLGSGAFLLSGVDTGKDRGRFLVLGWDSGEGELVLRRQIPGPESLRRPCSIAPLSEQPLRFAALDGQAGELWWFDADRAQPRLLSDAPELHSMRFVWMATEADSPAVRLTVSDSPWHTSPRWGNELEFLDANGEGAFELVP